MDGILAFLHQHEPYVEDAWRRIYRIVLVFALAFIGGFFLAGEVIRAVIQLLDLSDVSIVVTSPFQFLDLSLGVGFAIACLVTTPYTLWHFFVFLRPALSDREFRYLARTLPLALILFVVGFLYGFGALYLGLQALAKLNVYYGLSNVWDVGLFLSQLTSTAVLLAVFFEYPLILHALMRARVLTREWLRGKRRVAYALIIILVAFLPPTDGLSLIVMAAPLALLYELTILL